MFPNQLRTLEAHVHVLAGLYCYGTAQYPHAEAHFSAASEQQARDGAASAQACTSCLQACAILAQVGSPVLLVSFFGESTHGQGHVCTPCLQACAILAQVGRILRRTHWMCVCVCGLGGLFVFRTQTIVVWKFFVPGNQGETENTV